MLLCPGFVELMTSMLHHARHGQGRDAIELRAHKKPVPAWIWHAVSSELSLKTKHSYESQARGAVVLWCCCEFINRTLAEDPWH